MKLGIISDIHGNYPALSKVMDELSNWGCDEILCLGDVCGYYSMVNECIALLRDKNVITLKGNHDSYILGESKCPRSNSVNRCIEYQKNIITEDNKSWIAGLTSNIKTDRFFAVHGGWRDYLDEYIDSFDFQYAKSNMKDTNMFLSGHTHKQQLLQYGNLTYCNPGSVGQPRDYDSRAAYAILDDCGISLYRVAYNIDEIAEHMRVAGFSDYFFQNLYYGAKIGEKPNG